MGLFSGIGDLISAAVSVVGGFISSVSSALSAIASPVLKLATTVTKIVLKTVCDLISNIAKAFGLVPEEESPEELGARALQNPDIKPENYDSYQEYIAALNDAPFDEEAFKQSNDKQKDAYKVTGVGLETKAIAEKLDMAIPLDFYVAAAKGGIKSGEDGKALLLEMKNAGINDAGKFDDYVNGKIEDPQKEEQMAQAMKNFEAKGGKSFEDICADIDNKTLEKSVPQN